jgi:hypothetical protein
VALYGVLETAGFTLFTKFHSRMGIVQGGAEYEPITFMQLFDRYALLEPRWQMLIWLWVPSALWLATKRDKRYRPLLILPAVFLFLLTFLVRRVDPIVPWIGNKSRYLAVIAPFLVLGIAMLVVEHGRSVWQRLREKRPWRWLQRPFASLRSEPGTWTLLLCCVLGTVTYLKAHRQFRALKELRSQVSVLNDTYRRNLPILDFASFPRGLKTAYAVHLRDRYLAQSHAAPKGKLLDINDAIRNMRLDKKSVSYLLVNADAYSGEDLPQLYKKGCALVLHANKAGSIQLFPDRKLPARCRAPGDPPPLPP